MATAVKICRPIFCTRREAEVATLDDFDVVIGKTNGAEGQGGTHHQPDEGIAEIAPQQCGQQDGDEMSTPPMVGVPAFFWCPLGPSSRMYWPI